MVTDSLTASSPWPSLALRPTIPASTDSPPGTPDLVKAPFSGFTKPDNYPVNARDSTYYWGFSSVRHLCAAGSTCSIHEKACSPALTISFRLACIPE
jgi:hypothetical protein